MGLLDRLKGGGGPDALTAEIVARLRALPRVDTAEGVDADRISVVWSGHAGPQTVDLAELRPRWKQASGFDRIELVDGFIESLTADAGTGGDPAAEATPPSPPPVEPEPPSGWGALRTRVLPVLRSAGDGADCVRWPVGGSVDATVVLDGAPVAPDDCARWGVGELDVRAAATANLHDIDPSPEPIGPGARAWVPTAPAGGQSAWLTSPAPLLAALDLAEGVAFAPLASELVVVDPDDVDLLRGLLASTEQIVAEQADPLTAVPFLLTARGAEPWVPPAGHPLADDVAAIRRRAGAT